MTNPSQDRRGFEVGSWPDTTRREIARHIGGLADFLSQLTPQPDMVPDLPEAVTQLRRYREVITRGTARMPRYIALRAMDTAYRLDTPMHRAKITASGGRGDDLQLSANDHYAALAAVARGDFGPGEGLDPRPPRPERYQSEAQAAGVRAAVTDPVQVAVVHALRDVDDLPATVAEWAASAWHHASGDRVAALAEAVYAGSYEFGQRRGVDAAVGHIIGRVEATRASMGSAAGDPEVATVLDAVEGAARVRRSDPASSPYGSGPYQPTHRAHMAAISAASATAGEPAHQSAGEIARAVWPEGFRDGWRESFWHVNAAVNTATEFLDDKLFTTVVGDQPAASWLGRIAEQARDVANGPGDPFTARHRAVGGDPPGANPAAVSRLSFAAPPSAAPLSGAGEATNAPAAAPPQRKAPRGKAR